MSNWGFACVRWAGNSFHSYRCSLCMVVGRWCKDHCFCLMESVVLFGMCRCDKGKCVRIERRFIVCIVWMEVYYSQHQEALCLQTKGFLIPVCRTRTPEYCAAQKQVLHHHQTWTAAVSLSTKHSEQGPAKREPRQTNTEHCSWVAASTVKVVLHKGDITHLKL